MVHKREQLDVRFGEKGEEGTLTEHPSIDVLRTPRGLRTQETNSTNLYLTPLHTVEELSHCTVLKNFTGVR